MRGKGIAPKLGAEVVDAVRSGFIGSAEPQARAVVLTGSLARGEASWVCERGRVRCLGDAEFLVLVDGANRSGLEKRVRAISDRVQCGLADRQIDVAIELSVVGRTYFTGMRPHIFGFELIRHGQVVWGDARVLELIPTFAASQIPREDGFRMLANRVVELLEAICATPLDFARSQSLRYRAAKLWLDMATSFLLFRDEYQASYRERAQKLEILASAFRQGPLDLNAFARHVRVATAFKLGESCRSPVNDIDDFTTLVNQLRLLWNWELDRLLEGSSIAGNRPIDCWLRQQNTRERLRGWGSLVKRCGIARSLRYAPGWIPEAFKCSPRRLIYAAASDLFFALPELLQMESATGVPQKWAGERKPIPVYSDRTSSESWRAYGQSIGWNYHRFLESTRA